jgi:superoxide reductase
MDLTAIFQSADWKKEKHVPAIEAPAKVKKGELVTTTVSVGREIAHPNTTEHHIAWIDVHFHPDGEKYPYNLGRFEFATHGASTNGPNTSTVYVHPEVSFAFKTEKPGMIIAFSYCNIHGLWQSSREIKVE